MTAIGSYDNPAPFEEKPPYTPEEVATQARIVMEQINDMITGGELPSTVDCFGELHDYCDANMLGSAELAEEEDHARFNQVVVAVDRQLRERAERHTRALTDVNALREVVAENVALGRNPFIITEASYYGEKAGDTYLFIGNADGDSMAVALDADAIANLICNLERIQNL